MTVTETTEELISINLDLTDEQLEALAQLRDDAIAWESMTARQAELLEPLIRDLAEDGTANARREALIELWNWVDTPDDDGKRWSSVTGDRFHDLIEALSAVLLVQSIASLARPGDRIQLDYELRDVLLPADPAGHFVAADERGYIGVFNRTGTRVRGGL